MADQQHLAILKQGREAWNTWRQQYPEIQPDLSNVELPRARLIEADIRNTYFYGADLFSANLSQADLSETDLSRANLSETTLSYAKLSGAKLYRTRLNNANLFKADLTGSDLNYADLSNARLYGADLSGANLNRAYLSGADLREAHLKDVPLREADLRGADLTQSNLIGARIVRTNLSEAILTNCLVYGVAVWRANLQGANQDNLIVTPTDESTITVDNLKIAQFIYLLLDNEEIREVIDTIAKKAVIIIGRFSPERKSILEGIRIALRSEGYLPILFDFEKPDSQDLTGTVSTLANISRFIIADLSDPNCSPYEIGLIAPC